MYDSHTHLNDTKLFPNREQYLQQFIDIGGEGLINVGANHELNQNGLEISKKYPDSSVQKENFFMKSTIGFHPAEVVIPEFSEKNIPKIINELKKLYLQNRDYLVGVGECGIDLHYKNIQDKVGLQQNLFAAQLDLAKELDVPVVIHSRTAFDETFDILQNYKNLKIYYHCRGYGPTEIKKIQNYFPNLRIGFCGNVTYPKAENLRDSLEVTNLESMLIETDAPYLAPQNVRGTINHPANIQYLYKFAAEYLQIHEKKFQTQIKTNFLNLYN